MDDILDDFKIDISGNDAASLIAKSNCPFQITP